MRFPKAGQGFPVRFFVDQRSQAFHSCSLTGNQSPAIECLVRTRSTIVLVWLLVGGIAQAVILFGLDNSANQTDPGTGVPFDAVARVSNTAGTTLGGSAVHIGGGWMLTANHVGPFDSATFDGTTFYSRDTSIATVQLGTADMKLFRLTETPTVSAANIYAGSSENTGSATIIGWGVGRDPNVAVNSSTVGWGNNSTSAKRWGLNNPAGLTTINSGGYDFEALFTILGSSNGVPPGSGANEAAVTLLDSGGGMFQQIDGIWYLIGIATNVETFGSSSFGNNANIAGRGDANFYARVSNYYDQILSVTAIPEPSAAMLICLSMAALFVRRTRR